MNVPSESTGERAIKAELEHMGIRYEQEKDISSLYGDTKSHRRADFYLPDYDVYIEFLGGWDAPDEEKREEERRRYKQKMAIYHKNNIKCIYIYPKQLHYSSSVIKKRLNEFEEKGEIPELNPFSVDTFLKEELVEPKEEQKKIEYIRAKEKYEEFERIKIKEEKNHRLFKILGLILILGIILFSVWYFLYPHCSYENISVKDNIAKYVTVTSQNINSGKTNYEFLIENKLPIPISVNIVYDRTSKWYGVFDKDVNIVKDISARSSLSFRDSKFESNSGLPNMGDALVDNIRVNVFGAGIDELNITEKVCN